MPVNPAEPDSHWLEPGDLYLATGDLVEVDRPVFQGDVFADVPVLQLPTTPPDGEPAMLELPLNRQLVMVVPHPCQCYNGDNLRPHLTVAPVKLVEDYDNFGDDRRGAKDKFALPDLPALSESGGWKVGSHVADFGRLVSVPRKYLWQRKRVSCLSHKGLGLLAKRLALFQLRHPIALADAMAFTAAEWNESFLMQAWIRENEGRLKGYTNFMRTPVALEGVGEDPVVPYDVRVGALDKLLEAITGRAIDEPE